jgi:hypothetical protein
MILAAGDLADKHYSSYHRVFSAARWSLDRVGLGVFDLAGLWIDGDALPGQLRHDRQAAIIEQISCA